MADRERREPSTPAGTQATSTPDTFRSNRDYDLSTNAALHEISLEQGRILERLGDLAKSFKEVNDKVDKLTTAAAVVDAKLTPLGPKVDAHNRLYWIVIGGSAVVTLVVGMAWHYNSERMNRLVKILDNPAIERFVNKKPVAPRP